MYSVIVSFDWDAHNIGHIARHGVTPEEAEQVLRNDPLAVQFQDHAREERILSLGDTNNGKLLAVVSAEARGAVRVVTAYPMTKRQQEIYFRELYFRER